MKYKKFLKPTWKKVILFFIIVILLSLTFKLSLGTSPFWYAVSTNAMHPAYNLGDMVFIKKTDFDKLSVSDVVVFDGPENPSLLIMRIISIDENQNTFTTKGDNNAKSLLWEINIPSQNLKGKVIFSIPLLGYLDIYHIGFLVRIILIYILACFISLIPFRKNKSRR